MSDTARALRLTYEDYRDLPADGKRYELIEGDLTLTPAPVPRHQVVLGNLHLLLGPFVRAHDLGTVLFAPTDVVLSPTNVVQPDVLFVRRDRLGIIGRENVLGPPDLVVEVLSESNRRHDEVVKRNLYARFGIPEYWVVDPVLETVKVYRLDAEAYRRDAELALESADRLTSPLFPGLEVDLAEIFR